jgi:RNA polymerase sigma-70 factor (ECF subfamily)
VAKVPNGKSPTNSPSTRLTLLARLRSASDVEAWRLFVDLYLPLVFGYCRSRGLQDADARDVAQQVLAIVHKAIETFAYDPERGKFRHWLGTVTIHEIDRNRRKGKRAGQGTGDGQLANLAESACGEVDSAWLEDFNQHILGVALTRIRPAFDDDTWQAFDLSWLQDVKPAVAAATLGKSPGWVYKARYRVLQRLKSEIEFLTHDVAAFHKPG